MEVSFKFLSVVISEVTFCHLCWLVRICWMLNYFLDNLRVELAGNSNVGGTFSEIYMRLMTPLLSSKWRHFRPFPSIWRNFTRYSIASSVTCSEICQNFSNSAERLTIKKMESFRWRCEKFETVCRALFRHKITPFMMKRCTFFLAVCFQTVSKYSRHLHPNHILFFSAGSNKRWKVLTFFKEKNTE